LIVPSNFLGNLKPDQIKMDAPGPEEAEWIAPELKTPRTKYPALKQELRESQQKQKRLREENDKLCGRSPVPKPDQIKVDAAQPQASGLVRVLKLEDGVARTIIPQGHTLILRRASKALREAVEAARPAVKIKAKRGTSVAKLEGGLVGLQQWCLVTSLDLLAIRTGFEGAGRLAAVLGQCPSLAHLDLDYNGIRDSTLLLLVVDR